MKKKFRKLEQRARNIDSANGRIRRRKIAAKKDSKNILFIAPEIAQNMLE
jgi:hypothetical protein